MLTSFSLGHLFSANIALRHGVSDTTGFVSRTDRSLGNRVSQCGVTYRVRPVSCDTLVLSLSLLVLISYNRFLTIFLCKLDFLVSFIYLNVSLVLNKALGFILAFQKFKVISVDPEMTRTQNMPLWKSLRWPPSLIPLADHLYKNSDHQYSSFSAFIYVLL